MGPSPNECWEIGAAAQTETLIDLPGDNQVVSAIQESDRFTRDTRHKTSLWALLKMDMQETLMD